MKRFFNLLNILISIIALLIFASGIILALLGVYDLGKVFYYLVSGNSYTTALMAVSLLHAVDAFLVAIVFFVMSLGILVLFHNPEKPLPVNLPQWLRVENFMQLKVILWEAILTTLVVSSLARLAEMKIRGEEININSLVIPGIVFLFAISLFFLKIGEKH